MPNMQAKQKKNKKQKRERRERSNKEGEMGSCMKEKSYNLFFITAFRAPVFFLYLNWISLWHSWNLLNLSASSFYIQKYFKGEIEKEK